ncbi:hypothetical protein DPMN_044005 [Dreissena polymorpha]|uniref:Uncharacterized protein n=1 Tax=Dreissena polymorpha TaxID=45954 RepID=A0A9D4D3E0_DREPO|nr:hypothetical protein DPMN_044005 [Dreissena polymorpha]
MLYVCMSLPQETFSETQTEHLPHLLCSLITSLTRHCSHLPDAHILRMLRLCSKILSKVQPTVTVSGSHDHSADTSCDASMLEQVEVLTV